MLKLWDRHRDSTSQNAKSAKNSKEKALGSCDAKLLPLFCALKDFYETSNGHFEFIILKTVSLLFPFFGPKTFSMKKKIPVAKGQ